jgi:glc operon protein GlcG
MVRWPSGHGKNDKIFRENNKMRFTAALVLASLTAVPALGQTPPPAVPEEMPFDIPYGASISLEQANKAIEAAVAEAQKHKWKMSVSVVDPAGNLIAHATMNGAQYAAIPLSQAKARTSALFRRPSGVFQTAINQGGFPANATLLGMIGAVASEGGYPIVVDGKLVGAIGASGGVFTQDAVTAKAGLAVATSK